MLTKDQFIDLMTKLIDLYEKWSRFAETFNLVNDSPRPTFVTHQDIALTAIKYAMNDTEDFISWWMYDCMESDKRYEHTRPQAIVKVDGKDIKLDTLGKLYDYLAKK